MEFLTEKGRPSATAIKVHNNTGVAIAKGALVYISGFNNVAFKPTVALADGTDATKPAQLVMLSAMAIEADEWADTMALVSIYNTAARSVGDTCYLSVTTAGSIQWTAPTAAGHQVQPVGVCASVATIGDVYFTPGISFETQLGSTGIPAGSVTHAKLADDAVETHNIKDLNVTTAKAGIGVPKTVVAHVAHSDTSPTTLIALPAKTWLLNAMAICTESMDGNGTIDIGYSGNTNKIIPNAGFQKTAGNVTGNDPSQLGVDLFTQGAQTATASDWTNTQGTLSQTKTGADFALSALHVDETTHSMDSHTQAGTAGDWTATLGAGSQTKTAGDYSVTTWPRKLTKYYAAATTVIATISAGSTTTGEFDIVLEYVTIA